MFVALGVSEKLGIDLGAKQGETEESKWSSAAVGDWP